MFIGREEVKIGGFGVPELDFGVDSVSKILSVIFAIDRFSFKW